MSQPHPGFQYPKPTGKYDHPWIKQLPPGKATFYNVAYKAVATVLAAATAYGLFEVGRGSYHILQYRAQRDAAAAKAASEQ
mmetsp:Transcript_20938/g.45805  ORF Transcript_20938/g.45805 Transcript_20938/m.45805 type:complete len:81 (-) Transcript_20938:605-847(-)